MSAFESYGSGDDLWHPKKQPPKKRAPAARPIQISGVRTICGQCRQDAPMETLRAGKCLVCQVAEFLGHTL